MNKDIKELINEMSVKEKADLCSGASWWFTKENERLKIPAIMMAD